MRAPKTISSQLGIAARPFLRAEGCGPESLEVDVDGASGTLTAESLEETPAGPSPAAVVHTARSKTTSKATASPAKPKAKTAAKPVAVPSADDLAIPDYDSLAASQVVSRLAGLRPTELTAVQRYELHHRGRKTILGRIAQLQAS